MTDKVLDYLLVIHRCGEHQAYDQSMEVFREFGIGQTVYPGNLCRLDHGVVTSFACGLSTRGAGTTSIDSWYVFFEVDWPALHRTNWEMRDPFLKLPWLREHQITEGVECSSL